MSAPDKVQPAAKVCHCTMAERATLPGFAPKSRQAPHAPWPESSTCF